MVLIKVADISNEARPMNVAEPWLDKLFKVRGFCIDWYLDVSVILVWFPNSRFPNGKWILSIFFSEFSHLDDRIPELLTHL